MPKNISGSNKTQYHKTGFPNLKMFPALNRF